MAKRKASKKVITLPLSIKNTITALARIEAELNGDDPNDPEVLRPLIQKYAHEHHIHALTPNPSIGLAANPGTPRVAVSYFDELSSLFGPSGILSKVASDKQEREELERSLRSAIVHITRIYTKKMAGMKDRDTQYKQGAQASDIVAVEHARYFQALVALIVSKLVEAALSADPSEYKRVLDSFGITSKPAQALRKSDSRKEFSKAVSEKLNQALKDLFSGGIARKIRGEGK